MVTEDETLSPLLSARDRLDNTIAAYLDKVAALRKRREAINTAIEIVRAGDDEIMSLPTLVVRKNGKDRVFNFNESEVESRILSMLHSGEMSRPQIRGVLDSERLVYSISGLNRILKTSPKIKITGARDSTRYQLSS